MYKITTLDFRKCNSILDIHDELIKKLNFPNWYGRNLDGFWDLLTGYIELPIKIVIFMPDKNNSAYFFAKKVISIINTAIKQGYSIVIKIKE